MVEITIAELQGKLAEINKFIEDTEEGDKVNDIDKLKAEIDRLDNALNEVNGMIEDLKYARVWEENQ